MKNKVNAHVIPTNNVRDKHIFHRNNVFLLTFFHGNNAKYLTKSIGYGSKKAVKTSLRNAVNVVFDEKNGALLAVPLYMLWRLKTLLNALPDLDQ
jgi:hypothetical protein